jgi:hypothetical protein
VKSTLGYTKSMVLDIVSKPGFSHIGRLLVFLFGPIFGLFKKILVGIIALNKYESGFLSILVFVFAAVMGNFVGV